MNSARVQLFNASGRPFQMRAAPLPPELNPGEVLVQMTLATIKASGLPLPLQTIAGISRKRHTIAILNI